MFGLSWEIWRDWAIVQGVIIFISWLVVKFGKLQKESEDKKENGDA